MSEEDSQEKADRRGISRRNFLKAAGASTGVAVATLALGNKIVPGISPQPTSTATQVSQHSHPVGMSVASQTLGGITPRDILETFYYGEMKSDAIGQYREYNLTSTTSVVRVAKGVDFLAWTFNGPQGPTVPGPTLRCLEGDRLLIRFRNADSHPHTIHLHGIHPGLADGVFEVIQPGGTYDYSLVAEPFGLFLYHCHVMPVKKHIAKGLYGAFVVDPPASYGSRPQADHEFVMVMNGFDVDFDDENEFYSVNGIANYFLDNPINIRVGELVRIYLVNMTEFDPMNSFHLHGNMFRLYRTGTRFDPAAGFSRDQSVSLDTRVRDWLYKDQWAEVTDVVFLGQGERAVLEFVPKLEGNFLFHAHQSEFVELGWTGVFHVSP